VINIYNTKLIFVKYFLKKTNNGGGGGNRTRVLKSYNKERYMFSISFNFNV